MTHARTTMVLVVSLAVALLAAASAPPVAAANVNYTLYGGRGAATGNGWSFNSTQLSSPGPNLTATVGDLVTITVNRTDNRFHSWYLDYNDSGTWDQPEEPGADFPNATTLEAVTFSFTADRNGTFQYRSDHAGDGPLVGTFIISPAGGLFGGADSNTILVIVGSIVIVVAVIVFATYFWRRMKTPPPPPEKE